MKLMNDYYQSATITYKGTKGAPDITYDLGSANLSELLENVDAIIAKHAGTTPPPKTAKTVPVEAVGEPAPPAEAPPKISKPRAKKDEKLYLNERVLKLAERALVVSPELAAVNPTTADLVRSIGGGKYAVEMDVKELSNAVTQLHSILRAIAKEHPQVTAFLDVLEVIDQATDMAALEAGKTAFGAKVYGAEKVKGWKLLSSHAALFTYAKAENDSKEALLQAAEQVA